MLVGIGLVHSLSYEASYRYELLGEEVVDGLKSTKSERTIFNFSLFLSLLPFFDANMCGSDFGCTVRICLVIPQEKVIRTREQVLHTCVRVNKNGAKYVRAS